MEIFEPEDDEVKKKYRKPKDINGNDFPDYLLESHKRELAMQQRMFDEADLHRQEYQKLLFKHTKLEIEHRSMINEILLLRTGFI
jgi:hypothetical protein